MNEDEWLTARFAEHREHLRAVAYRMLGSTTEADDALQDAWLRASRAGADDIDNVAGWLTTIVSRVCLNMLRARNTRRVDERVPPLPDPVVTLESDERPDEEVLMADSVGLALLVVLDTLNPAERLAFVLHDMFGLPFEEIAPMVDRSPVATRQLASRARRRVRGSPVSSPEVDPRRQRAVVEAFFAAARQGDFDGLVAVLDPDVVLRSDGGDARPALSMAVRGADEVAAKAMMFAVPAAHLEPVRVNGNAGALVLMGGSPVSLMSFTVDGGAIVAIDAISEPDRVARLARPVLDRLDVREER
jgi:RNA polymerase sigma factor (sigma-70 family)